MFLTRKAPTSSLALATFIFLDPSGADALTAFRDSNLARAPIILAQVRPPSRTNQPAQPEPTLETLEGRFWAIIKESKDPSDFQMYLDAYPNGKFAAQARARLLAIQGDSSPSTPPPALPAPSVPQSPTRPAARPAPTTPSAPQPSEKPASPTQSPPAASTRPTPRPESPAPPQPAPPPFVIESGRQADRSASETIKDCAQCPALVLMKPGTFMMGSTEFFPFEGPVHSVTIRKPFYIGQREVTFDEWDACVKEGGCSLSPSDRGQGRGLLPVTNLSWSDTQQYLLWLTRKTGKTYRLPTESEWEYAARAGTTTTYYWGSAMEKGRANCSGCDTLTRNAASPTGSLPANPLGLFDMSGNAAEWVEDCWHDSYRGAPTDGSAWTSASCSERVLRGGSFGNDPRYVRSASRFKYDFDVRYYANGFRVVREN